VFANKKPDVVIVGGGIIGCSVAFFLAKAGVYPLVLERGQVGGEASSGAAGMLTAQTHTDEAGALFDLKLASRGLYEGLANELLERTGLDIEYRRLGHVAPAFSDEEDAGVTRRVAWQRARGLPAEKLDARQARAMEPGLASDVRGAGWFPEDHHINNSAATQALASATMRLGGKFRTGCAVLDLAGEGPRVTGVRTESETVSAGAVILCAGAWMQQFEKASGIPLPIVPAKGQMVVAKLELPALRHVVYGSEVYAIPRASGEHIIGSTVEFVGFDKRVTVEGITRILKEVTRLVPVLHEAAMVTSWACLRPAAPDGLPLLGKVPARPGLFVATGHFRNGILLAPITGMIMTELIVDGTSSIPLDPFRPDRPMPAAQPLAIDTY